MAQVHATHLHVGEWKKKGYKGKTHSRFELRLAQTGLLVGLAYSNDEGKNLEIYAFFHDPYNTNSESKDIKYTENTVTIYTHWSELMDKVLEKMFV